MKTRALHNHNSPDPFATARQRGLITTGHHLPYNPKLVQRARDLRRHMTLAESRLWYDYLRRFTYRVLRQRPIDHYIVDFYCAELRLVIEIDGESHFTDAGKSCDSQRDAVLESYGLRVLRLTNAQVMNEFEGVCQVIASIPPCPP
jgi:very-short-patch-repair endonuclease